MCLIARERGGCLIWGLPKGHVEHGERLEQTAIREVREETGLQGELIRKIGAIRYGCELRLGERWAARGAGAPQRCAKTVHFFLLRYTRGSTEAHDDEVQEARWVPADKAIASLTYDNERTIMREAIAHLSLLKARIPYARR